MKFYFNKLFPPKHLKLLQTFKLKLTLIFSSLSQGIPIARYSLLPRCPSNEESSRMGVGTWFERLKVTSRLFCSTRKHVRLPTFSRSHAWYHGPIPRQRAEEILRVEGDFLVRDCVSQPGNYVLSCKTKTTQTLHFVINKVSWIIVNLCWKTTRVFLRNKFWGIYFFEKNLYSMRKLRGGAGEVQKERFGWDWEDLFMCMQNICSSFKTSGALSKF